MEGKRGSECLLKPVSNIDFNPAFPNAKVKTIINVSELLGAESQLYCKVGSQEFIAMVNARDHIQPGTEVEVGF